MGMRPFKTSVRSPSGILTNAATTGGPPGTGGPGGRGGPANTMFAAGGAGGGTGAGATPAVMAVQRPQSRAINRPVAAPPPSMIAGPMAQAPPPSMIAGPMAQAPHPSQQAASSSVGGGFGDPRQGVDRYAGLDLTSRANSNARMVLPSAVEQRAAIAAGGTAYSPEVTARIEQIRKNEAMVPTGTTDLHNRGYEEYFAPGGLYDQGVRGDVSAGGGGGGGGGIDLGGGGGGGDSYADMYGDMRDDAGTAFDTSEAYFTDEGGLAGDYWSGVGDRAGGYWDDRGTAASDYYGGVRDDTLEYLTGRQGREQDQILAMANMRRGNIGDEYQWMTDALDTEEGRRGGVYDQLELDRGARLDTNEAALLGQMGTLEGERLTQEQAMMDALGGRYTTAQGGLDERRLGAEAALREQGVGPEAYTSAVGAETAALLGSQGLSSQDLQGRLASIAASEATDRSLGATGMFQDARSALADQLFGGRADLAENIAGRRTGLGQQNLQALAGVGTGELGAQQSLLNEIAQGQFGAGQAYGAGMYDTGEQVAAGRFNADEAARSGAFGAGQTQRAGVYGAQQAYQSEVSRIDQLEASGQISRAEAAQAKSEAAAKSSQAEAAEAAQFATIDAQMGLKPGTAQAMSTGGLLGDLYGDMMGSTAGQYENMMPWSPMGSDESYFVDPEIAMRAEIDQQQGTPVATYPVVINGVEVQMPISGWPDVESSQEYEARR